MRAVNPLYIIGAGGFGREVAWLVERINAKTPTWDFKGFLDDNSILWNREVDGYKIHGGHLVLERDKGDVWCVLAVGNALARKRAVERLQPFPHIHFATLIDPNVETSKSVSVGEGSVICAGTIITVDVSIGRHNIINLNCTIGHDAVLKDFVTLYPSVDISGAVTVGECSEIGVGTQIIQGLSIGSRVVIGAGSCVIRNVEDGVTALGIPARVIKKNSM